MRRPAESDFTSLVFVYRTPNMLDGALGRGKRATTTIMMKSSSRWLGLLALAVLMSPSAAYWYSDYDDDQCYEGRQHLGGTGKGRRGDACISRPGLLQRPGLCRTSLVVPCFRQFFSCMASWVSVPRSKPMKLAAKTGRYLGSVVHSFPLSSQASSFPCSPPTVTPLVCANVLGFKYRPQVTTGTATATITTTGPSAATTGATAAPAPVW